VLISCFYWLFRHLLGSQQEMEAAIDKVSNYLIALGEQRTDEILEQWPQLHKELNTAIHAARRRELSAPSTPT